jgi:hypothetical protein
MFLILFFHISEFKTFVGAVQSPEVSRWAKEGRDHTSQ